MISEDSYNKVTNREYFNKKLCKLYSHLLDIVENDRCNEHYSKWCELERELANLIGNETLSNYFKELTDKENEIN